MKKLTLIILSIMSVMPGITEANQTLVELVKNVRSSVVLIHKFDQDKNLLKRGSGFFINAEGDLITNMHVVEGAYSATAKLITGQEYSIEGASAVDKEHDIVKLRINVEKEITNFLKPFDELPPVGEDIVVVGNPLGLESTVSKGIISAVRKSTQYGDILQISAPISPGSSGSPVLNLRGQVIGIATLTIKEGQALNFAIPSKIILNLESFDNVVTLSQLSQSSPQPDSETAQEIPATRAVNNPCLKYFPDDWWLAGNLNIKAVFEFIEKTQGEQKALTMVIEHYLQMVQGMVGIDLKEQVQYVTFAFSGDPVLSLEGLVVIKGTFENSVLELRLNLGIFKGMDKTSYGGATLYENAVFGYSFPEKSTVVVGTPSFMRKSLAGVTTENHPLPGLLSRTLRRTNEESFFWMVTKPKELMKMKDFNKGQVRSAEFDNMIASIEYASVFIEPTLDGYLLSILANVPNPECSKNLYTLLTNVRKHILDEMGSNVFVCSFLTMSEILLDGNYVRWDTHLTQSSLFELWNTQFIRKKIQKQITSKTQDSDLISTRCKNDSCGAEYQMNKAAYFKHIIDNSDPLTTSIPAITCEKCGQESVYRTQRCKNADCGAVFFWGSIPNNFPDRCPKCNYSEREEKNKK